MVRTRLPLRPAFTLIELLVVIAIIALLVSILMPALACARTEARRSVCHANMKTLGTAFSNYSTEFQDRCASFTWKAGVNYGFGGTAADATAAAANQAYWIIRERGFRQNDSRFSSAPSLWIPHVLYSHLVMNDYMESRLPEVAMACPEDRLRLQWQKDPENFETLFPAGVMAPGGDRRERWPYSSSYQLAPAAWAYDAKIGTRITTDQHGLSHNRFHSSQLPMGDRKYADVAFPAQKVAWFDASDRHSCRGEATFFAHDSGRQPLAFFDGHVSTKKTADSNVGFRPNTPNVGGPTPTQPRGSGNTLISYEPEPWEAPAVSPNGVDRLPGVFRWTRGGLRGLDFGGREISTSDW